MTIKRFILIVFVFVAGTSLLSPAKSSRRPADARKGAEMATQIARGQYIVQGVAVCGQCHTPRDSNGQPEPNHQLEGGPVWFQPAAPMADWPLKAPRLAGTPPASEADMVRLLTTGIWTNGQQLRAPMPQFRMTKEDAEAVVAYLRSLTPNRP